MEYAILIVILIAVAIVFYVLAQRATTAVEQSVSRQKERIARELKDMFILRQFTVEELQRIKWGLAFGFASIGVIVAWETVWPAPAVVGVAMGILGYWAPEISLSILRSRRKAAFSNQLIDALTLMANTMRAGIQLKGAVGVVRDEMPAPISQEFDLVIKEVEAGLEIDAALRNCVERTGDEDLDLAVSAIMITLRQGGNLAEVFDRIVAMVRERKIMAGKAEALTSEGRLQAMVVGLLPYAFMFAMVKMNPDFMRVMWTTIPGFIALVAIVILDFIGYMWVRKVADVKF